MCYVLWFRRHYKLQREKARGKNNDLSYVPSKRKEEIKSGTSGCGSFVAPYFQPATSTDRLHLYITNIVVHALIKPEKQQGNTSVLVHHGQQEHCNACPYQTWKTTGQYFCPCTAQTLWHTPRATTTKKGNTSVFVHHGQQEHCTQHLISARPKRQQSNASVTLAAQTSQTQQNKLLPDMSRKLLQFFTSQTAWTQWYTLLYKPWKTTGKHLCPSMIKTDSK